MEFIEQLTALLLGLGATGLFLLAVADSAGVPMNGGPDLILLLLAAHAQGPADLLLLVCAAVVGSAVGCLALHRIGVRGGQRVLDRFAPARRSAIKGRIDRKGIWSVVAAAMGPPPYPTKVVMVLAGAFRMGTGSFLGGVLLGRVLRYGAVAYLAARFGERGWDLIGAHSSWAALVLVGLVALGLVSRRPWRLRVPVESAEPPALEPVPSSSAPGQDA